MNDKALAAQQKARQERKRGLHAKAVKRLEQAIAATPDELELYLDAVDAALEGGEVMQATHFLKLAQDRFTKEKDRLSAFIEEKLSLVHDPALARFAIENMVKLRDLESALKLLGLVPEHTARDLLTRVRTKKQTLRSASHGGYTLRNELLTNELMSATLSLRIGNLKEAVTTVVQILDEKPVEHKMLMPFLSSLEGTHLKSGRVRFARACAMLAAGNELEAIGRFLEAAKLEPPVAALCAERLTALRETTKARAKVDRALAEVLLLKGDLQEAAGFLREYLAGSLETNNEAGREVMLLLRPYIDPAGGLNECTWVALDAAMTIEQSNVALELLRPLHQRGECTAELCDWLDAKSKEVPVTGDMKLFHATLSLELKRHERAAEMLESVCETSPADAAAAIGLLDRHRSEHPSLEALYKKHSAPEPLDDSAPGEGDFQVFENREFKFQGSAPAPNTPPKPAESKPAQRFADTMKKKLPKNRFVDAREISFDGDDAADDDAPVLESAPTPGDGDGPGDDFSVDSFATNGLGAGARPILTKTRNAQEFSPADLESPAAASSETRKPNVEITESHVQNVAQKLYESGARTFFHVDGDAESAPVTAEPSTDAATSPPAPEAPAEPAPPPAEDSTEAAPDRPPEPPAAEDTPEPVLPETASTSFDDEMQRFRRGGMSKRAMVVLLERAAQERRIEQLEELLSFQPENDAERFTREYYQAECQLLRGRVLPALETFRALDTPSLSVDQKQRVWLKMATCQRMVKDFAAAGETLKRLQAEFPDHEEFARLARTNHEQYLSEQGNRAHVLEKTTTLD